MGCYATVPSTGWLRYNQRLAGCWPAAYVTEFW